MAKTPDSNSRSSTGTQRMPAAPAKPAAGQRVYENTTRGYPVVTTGQEARKAAKAKPIPGGGENGING